MVFSRAVQGRLLRSARLGRLSGTGEKFLLYTSLPHTDTGDEIIGSISLDFTVDKEGRRQKKNKRDEAVGARPCRASIEVKRAMTLLLRHQMHRPSRQVETLVSRLAHTRHKGPCSPSFLPSKMFSHLNRQ